MNIIIGRKLSDGTGGEGSVYEINGYPNYVYKQFFSYKLDHKLQSKLDYMAENPIETNMNDCFSWPTELKRNDSGRLDGFVMPKLYFDVKLNKIYESDKYPYKWRVGVARNLCALVRQVHKNNIVIGDFNHGNVGVNFEDAFVSMMDCDSFHLDNGRHRCGVCMDGYAAPELLRHLRSLNTMRYDEAELPTFTKNTDLFSLAVHIFCLLMNGISPYNGIDMKITGSSNVAGVGNKPIEDGMYVFKQGNIASSPLVPPQIIVTDKIGEMFDSAFMTDNGEGRPNSLEWVAALDEYILLLKQCPKNKTHQYYNRLSCCPWCEADSRQSIFSRLISRKSIPEYTVRRI